MEFRLNRRDWIQSTALLTGAAAVSTTQSASAEIHGLRADGTVTGSLTGAMAVVDTLRSEGVRCVFGIPGAQENELWDTFKQRGLDYLLVTHEFSASCMADGYARASGQPGVLCVVPGPGVTNAMTGLGEALLDSIPLVAIVGDIARGEKYRPFQVHALDQVALLKPVTKAVYLVESVEQIPDAIRTAFAQAKCGEPGPVAVVIPWTLFIEKAGVHSPPRGPQPVPWDEANFQAALAILRDPRRRVGIYAGLGCMDSGPTLACVAELLQAPVATSVSGKGCIPETHRLAVGWGYGAHATRTAEKIFAGEPLHPFRSGVDTLLAIGVKFSEVSTGFYSNPQPKTVIHVDANACNLGQVLQTDVKVHADANVFLQRLLGCGEMIRRPTDERLLNRIATLKADDAAEHARDLRTDSGVEPTALILALRRAIPANGLFYVDVTVSEHTAAEAYTTCLPRTYFNPTDNQAMGWSIPAAIGGAVACPGRVVATLTGDGCFLMSALELSTAAREQIPVKFFVLDDHTYHYMQLLQQPAYGRTTATVLAKMDYCSLARGLGIGYLEIHQPGNLDAQVRHALACPGPILIRVRTQYTTRPVRWLESVRGRFTDELSTRQKARFLARIGARSLHLRDRSD
ncbi:thiamine pyrophosphate-binding protein [Tuwongella immobilis]|uniref:Thiamine pyrophosphate enzyme TPP-binding domain-containing protein n=1 Tax=Tuwongella immobilis TaxID=692036 RepID=A0A6C2YTU5_9BACT|nr:thiamine pyrophosphate-binding protein [Tuwongella immobilis]VIP04811.1 thiamine pyrophosphate n-terminal tpp binding domain protein : Thiamine pyrophosphate-dependent enzyme, possible carboligase or decarboxylase OS=Singulisphaera acidiphila (strain ATCC BAA-1392 / DSM 18658 / VKM B-2454 / MOB10) GN=Sinac_2269 PE=4 SV=1: TPP_enzyme_N: TPP_enzyme_M: TPP_enzyme_C [Tuwongella immobilis]VTS06982.1 thiamine pyrophosphate n-terminal tpp binding domain protein : Thiamine pyrophosphate-dependent enzy